MAIGVTQPFSFFPARTWLSLPVVQTHHSTRCYSQPLIIIKLQAAFVGHFLLHLKTGSKAFACPYGNGFGRVLFYTQTLQHPVMRSELIFHRSFSSRLAIGYMATLLIMLMASCTNRSSTPRVLVFSKTAGFHHNSIPNGIAAIQSLGNKNHFEVDTTTNADWFNDDSLKNYAAVIFLSSTGDILNSRQQTAFERYIQAGGGYVGIHAAADAEYDWGWYGRLAGAYFLDHPSMNDTFPQIQEAVLHIADANHPATKGLPKDWRRKDEWYNFKKLSKDIHPLIMLDESTYRGGRMGSSHPVSWYHEYDGGRAFYTALGHTEESYSEPLFLQHILGGIQYAIGDNKKLDYNKATAQYAPDDDRFVKTTLAQGVFFEPTEMAILPDLDILITQRRGEILRYSQKDKTVKQVGFLNVYYQTLHTPGVNAEEGVLGIAPDPDFAKNHYVYIYYSPSDSSVNQLSRFTYENDTIDTRSEKVILQVHSQREICCHTGGSIAFGADHTLFLSTGDNSTPFDEPKQPYANHGFAPLDDRPGHQQYDARRSAGNTNDLRGKILRIKINPDGSYTIPEGNLFSANEPKARPEIYVMGDRNPYRISVDKKNGNLYWGEVGPDSGVDSLATRGPRGYDEVNQARKAGFFGWPLFIGNNYAYHPHNYNTNENGPAFDPQHPVNDSRNNTGLQQLPPAQPAFIWYPYAVSNEFPELGTGGRTAMAGPVYYTDGYAKNTRLPDYYNGKLLIYEWMRNWVKAVTMLPNGDFDKMEPFAPNVKLAAPIDMEAGPDGRIYVLEYGSGWFSKNPDAALSRIDYIAGNRPPKVDSFQVNKTSGSTPLTITATVKAKDPENDNMVYVWSIGNFKKQTSEPTMTYTIDKPGEYPVTVSVMDNQNATTQSEEVVVVAGNEQPQIRIAVQGNQRFYFPGKPVAYSVNVTDKGDSVDLHNLFISTNYVRSNKELQSEQGHQVVNELIMGRNLMMSLDCKSCHQVAQKSIGPAFMQVSNKYKKDAKARDYLVQKIIKGGSGVWGETAMPAHPTLKEQDAAHIVQWVLSLANEQANKSLPPNGTITPKAPAKPTPNTMLALTASYTDKGAPGAKPLSATEVYFLRSNHIAASEIDASDHFSPKDSAGTSYLVFPAGEGWLRISRVDLTGVKSVQLTGVGSGASGQYTLEVHAGQPTGSKLGSGTITFTNKQTVTATIPVQVTGGTAAQDLFIVCRPTATTHTGGNANARPLLKAIVLAP